MPTHHTDTQLYKVIRQEKDFEIRFYPSVMMATVISPAKTYKELGNSVFGKLAGFIFGANHTKQKIAMTSPVHMSVEAETASMSFVMPSQYNQDNLPRPNNPEIVIKTTAGEYVAAIGFGGYASEKDVHIYTQKLKQALEQASVSYYGNFRLLGYNAPYQFFNRKNEIIVSVNQDQVPE
jgi:SOUL heme-binding protein